MRKSLLTLVPVCLLMVAFPAASASASDPCFVSRHGVGYGSVQEAIDHSRSGDTLGIYGTCAETFTIDRDLSLQGFQGYNGSLSGHITTTPGTTVKLGALDLQGVIVNAGTLTLRRDFASVQVSEGAAHATTLVQDSYLTESAVDTFYVRVSRSTFNGTEDTYSVSGGYVRVDRSTITGTTGTNFDSGAIYAGARLHVIGSTIAGNIDVEGGSPGVANYEDAHVSISSSILYNNNPFDCAGVINSGGYNIIGNLGDGGRCQFNAQPTDQIGVDPLLGPLMGNGPRTFPLQPGSPAIDAIPVGAVGANSNHPPLCRPGSRDERGQPRPYGTGCDIGAFEVGAS